jgi:hypothetical protein
MKLPADADRLLATLRTGAWLGAQVLPPLAYAVPGLIPEGSVLLVGAPKIGKSWMVLSIALAAAVGGRALGIEVPQRPVLYLALEDGHRRLQDRCRRLLADDPIPEQFQYITMIGLSRAGSPPPSPPGFIGTRNHRRWSSWTPSARSCRRPSSASRPISGTTGSGRPSSASWTASRG